MKKVSLVIPVYNLEEVLSACLETVINQTYKNLEIILLDDGSADNSLAVCEAFGKQDSRIKVLHHKNHGVSYTRNRGLKEATGDYLMFLDGDDWVDTSMVAEYVNAAEENNADAVIGGLTVVAADKTTTLKKPERLGLWGQEVWNMICFDTSGLFGYAPNKLYRTALLQEHGITFDLKMYAQEDLDFALSAYDVCRTFCFIDNVGYHYRYSPGKRSHPYDHYIKNQLKMLHLAASHCALEKYSREAILQRIEKLVYVALYEASADHFSEVFARYYDIKDLRSQLSGRTFVNHPLVLKMFCHNRILLLREYFIARKWISRRIHGSGH